MFRKAPGLATGRHAASRLMYIAITILFTLGYVLLIGIYHRAWKQLPAFRPNQQKEGRNFISVIVPARDEASGIARCLASLAAQDYPQDSFEVLLVDDYSADETAQVAADTGMANLTVIRMSEIPLAPGEVAYKKRAIETGVSMSRGTVIATTDADCTHHSAWLSTIDAAFRELDTDMVSGPVLFEFDQSLFQVFQALDFIGMIGITAASLKLGMFNLANGANLAFRKSVFEAVGGYQGIDRKASGDDMLLIYKFASRNPEKVRFLKSVHAAVFTRPAPTFGEFLQQRLRWTSKSFSYQDRRITWILAFVYLTNLLLLAHLGMLAITSEWAFALLFTGQFLAMSLIDYRFLRRVTGFFDRRILLRRFPASQFIHVLYIISIGLLGNLLPYKWKGRILR